MTAATNQDNALLVDLSDSNKDEVKLVDVVSQGASAVPDGMTDLLFMPGDLFNLTSDETGLEENPWNANSTNTKDAVEKVNGSLSKIGTSALASSSESPTSTTKKAKKEQEKGELRPRNRASHNRLQSEFGWQMGLQAAKVGTPPVVPESESEKLEESQGHAPDDAPVNAGKVPKQDVKHEATPLVEKKKPEPEVIEVEELKPPSMHRKDKSDTGSTSSSKVTRNLAKKEFGWQLALQENVGSLVLKPAAAKDASLHDQQIDGLPKIQREESNNPSQLSLHANGHKLDPSGSSSIQLETIRDAPLSPRKNAEKREFVLPEPLANQLSLKSHPTLQEQLNMPVRSEFGWQVGLASKSLTFPLSKPSQWAAAPDNLSTSEFGTYGNGVAAAKSSESLRTDWRTVAGSGEPGEPVFNTREPQGDGEFSCQLCFGNISVFEARGLEGCDHQFCMPCLQRFILQGLGEQSFPIYCPACDIDEPRARGAATESILLASNMGPEDMERFYTLELRSRPVEVECPDCRVISEVPWVSYNNRSWSSCATCAYRWCKVCHKATPRGLEGLHVCLQTGAKEPRKKRKEAWKQARHCPGCGLRPAITSTGKKSNEVVCSTRGCHIHFCYVCGHVMADGTETTDIRSAVNAHNRANPTCAPSKHGCTIQ